MPSGGGTGDSRRRERSEFDGLNAVVFTLGEEPFAVSSAEIASLVVAKYRRYAGCSVRDFVLMLIGQAVRTLLRERVALIP